MKYGFLKIAIKKQHDSNKPQNPTKPLQNIYGFLLIIKTICMKPHIITTRAFAPRRERSDAHRDARVTCAVRIRAATRASRRACYKEAFVVIMWMSQYMYRFHKIPEPVFVSYITSVGFWNSGGQHCVCVVVNSYNVWNQYKSHRVAHAWNEMKNEWMDEEWMNERMKGNDFGGVYGTSILCHRISGPS